MMTQMMTQVTNSIFEVMETMFFLTLEKQKQPVPDPMALDRIKTAAITFSGEFSGTIFLGIPEPLLRTMTENLMGEDIETLTPDHVDGTLKEALNMIAGSTLTRVDDKAYMGLGIPEVVSPPAPDDIDDTVILSTSQDLLVAHVKLN
ncbi:MAG: chemotaxis protein CheX [Desulfobacterales bacterium]|nr:chemotaxis protein CheX [Desulfobacterales bacterium]